MPSTPAKPLTPLQAALPADVRVVVADAHEVVRDGLRAALGDDLVVAEAGDLEELVAAVRAHRPNVVLLGLSPDTAVVGAVIGALPGVAVLVFSSLDDPVTVSAALRNGVRGFLGRDTPPVAIASAVRGVAAGWAVLTPAAANNLANVVAAPAPFPVLTEREQEVLELLAEGAPTSAAARRLGVTAKTVCNHVSRILAKLGAPDRAAAVALAREAGLGREKFPR